MADKCSACGGSGTVTATDNGGNSVKISCGHCGGSGNQSS